MLLHGEVPTDNFRQIGPRVTLYITIFSASNRLHMKTLKFMALMWVLKQGFRVKSTRTVSLSALPH